MGLVKLLGSLVSFFNQIFKNQRDNELRKDGARKADISQRDKIDKIRVEAKKIRRDSPPGSKSDILKRL